jgi:voltage-gated potassium channel
MSPDPRSHSGALRRTIDAPARAWRALSRHPPGRRLYFGRPSSAVTSLLRRMAIVVALVVAVIVVFALDRDGLRDTVDGDVSVADVVYFAFITITTVGYGDIVPVTTSARLLDAFFVTPIRLFVWAIFFGTAYQFVAQRIIEDFRMRLRQADLSDHIVICGFGLSGRSAARELVRRGEAPAHIVAIDHNESALLEAAEEGMVGLRGDATRESILKDANIRAARTAIVCLGRDDTTVLCTLTLRSLAPDLRIVSMVKEAENETLVERGGASATICPSTMSGILMANSVSSSRVASYIHDMLTIDGRVMLEDRLATDADAGRRPMDLHDGIALRIHRGDRVIGFWEPEARVLAGDRLIVLAPRGSRSGSEPQQPG